MTPNKLLVRSKSHAYEVHVGPGLLAGVADVVAGLPFAIPGRRCAVVTDDHVAALYAGTVLDALRAGGHLPSLIIVPAGEASKSMSEVARVAEAMIGAKIDRHGFVVALGGGVVGDLAGFVASIYHRGIPFVQVPTTIISQVDSAIGGKTGVNTASGKNLLGTFYPPAAVVADVDTLDSLPEREFNEGFAEIIKHGMIRDPGLFERLFNFERRNSGDALTEIILRNLQIKADIVAADEFERSGERALLNFGHTVGHAIEHAAGYGRFLHGEAISIGMIAAGRLSMEKARLSQADFGRLVALLQRFSLPLQLPPDVDVELIMESLGRDKKFEGSAIRFVLTRSIGEAFLSSPGQITEEDIRRVIADLCTAP